MIPQGDSQDLPVVHTMVSQVIVSVCDPEMQMGLVFPLLWKKIKKPFADLGNRLRRIIIIWNHANTDVRTFIFPRLFNYSAREFTRFPGGASHGQPSYSTCTRSRMQMRLVSPLFLKESTKPFAELGNRLRFSSGSCAETL